MDFFQRTKNGYLYDKRIFWGAFAVCCIIALYIFYQYNFDFSKKLYFVCDDPIECHNTIMDYPNLMKHCHEDWCMQEKIPKGVYGTPPPNDWLFNNFKWIVFFIMIATIPLNHLLHNRGNKFEFLNPFPKWMIKHFGKDSKFNKFINSLEDDEEK